MSPAVIAPACTVPVRWKESYESRGDCAGMHRTSTLEYVAEKEVGAGNNEATLEERGSTQLSTHKPLSTQVDQCKCQGGRD